MGVGLGQKLHHKLAGIASQAPKLKFPLPVSTAPHVVRSVNG